MDELLRARGSTPDADDLALTGVAINVPEAGVK
jgi:hypothetical protein